MKPKVAFICLHNSCRSQIAEALGKRFAGDVFESYSAGSNPDEKLDPLSIQVMKDLYDMDISLEQKPKSIKDIPSPDIIITFGCDARCMMISSSTIKRKWPLEDPRGKSDIAYRSIAKQIEHRIKLMKKMIQDAAR